MELIKLSNDDLPVDSWRVGKVGEPTNGLRKVVKILNEESLSLLESRKGFIIYGFGKVHLKVTRTKPTANAAVPKVPEVENERTEAQTDDNPYTYFSDFTRSSPKSPL